MAAAEDTGRPNQRSRTRKDLLRAAARLMKHGQNPSLEEVATEALVSRATAYRYFPSVEALLVDAALHDMILANEPALRTMLAHALQRGLRGDDADHPRRQNRRSPLIEAALEPARKQFKPAALATLSKALALIVGPEGVVVCKDVLQLDDAEARKVKRWAIQAMVEAAKKQSARH